MGILTGQEIRKWRELARMTQADLAKRLDVHPRTVSSWEQGRQKPPAMLATVLQALRPKAKPKRARRRGRV